MYVMFIFASNVLRGFHLYGKVMGARGLITTTHAHGKRGFHNCMFRCLQNTVSVAVHYMLPLMNT